MRIAAVSGLILVLVLAEGCRSGPEEPERPPLPIQVSEFPETVMLARSYVGPYAGVGEAISEFIDYLSKRAIAPQGDLMGVFMDDPSKTSPEETRYELRVPVRAGTAATAPYRLVTTPGQLHAMIELVGSYAEVAEWYPDIYRWIDDNDWEVAGPLIEIYRKHPGLGVPPEEFVTEVHIPVEAKSR